MKTMGQILVRATLLSGAFMVLAGCSSTAIGPAYTQAELKLICERQGGWWHRGDVIGGYCEYRTSSG